jgi:acyl-CoA thioester hydrolase
MSRSDFKFFEDFRVRYSEIDGQGVVFNAHYLTYFDVAINEYFRMLAFDYSVYPSQTGWDFHLVKSLVNYEKPLLFDMEFDVGVRTAKVGNSSIVFELVIFAKDTDTRFATGEIIWVNTDQSNHQPVRIGDDIRALLTGFEDKS